jgi:ADP-ribose pyrophosphatase
MGGEELRVIAQGKFLRFVNLNGWEYVDRPNISGIVMIAPVTDDGKIVLVEQYRPPLRARVLELPAGLIGDIAGKEEEELLEGTRRELLEETGYEAGELIHIGAGPISPGLTDESVNVFVARKLRKVAAGGGDAKESIEVHEVPIAHIHEFLATKERAGCKIDLKIFMGLYFAERK